MNGGKTVRMTKRSVRAFFFAALVFCLSACSSSVRRTAEQAPVISTGVLSGPENTRSNSLPLINRAARKSAAEFSFDVEKLYITVYPTYDANGALLTREAFKMHRSGIKSYDPRLNAHIWQGNPEDPENRDYRFGFDNEQYNCTIAVRGDSSRGAPIKNFKVRLTGKGQRLYGTDVLNFNKSLYDQSRTSNIMALSLLQLIERDLNGISTRLVRLYINDVRPDGGESGFVDQGLYGWFEQPNRDFLENHGFDPKGSMYKPQLFEFRIYPELRAEDDPEYDPAAWRRRIPNMTNPDHKKVLDMLAAVNDYSRNFSDVMAEYFDEENYLSWMAVNFLFGSPDAVSRNFLLYSPSGSKKWYFLPWDLDETMVYYDVETWARRPFQQYGINYFWSVPMHQRYFRVPGNAAKLSAKMDMFMAKYFTRENVETLSRNYLRVYREFMPREPDYSMQMLAIYLDTTGYADVPDPDVVFDPAWRRRMANNRLMSFWFWPGIYAEAQDEISRRYSAIVNNRRRFERALQYPTAIYMQEPERVEGGWVFRWDASFDHHQNAITYDFVLSTGFDDLAPFASRQRNIFLRRTGLRATSIRIPDSELPAAPVIYRVMPVDSMGNRQFPLNSVLRRRADGENAVLYHTAGMFDPRERPAPGSR